MLRAANLIGRPSLKTVQRVVPANNYVRYLPRILNQASRSLATCSGARETVHSGYRSRLNAPLKIIRHCSYNRTMCRAKDDVAGASLDVSKGREVLPTNVKPLHYDLTLEPNFEKFTYEGKVVIEYVEPILPSGHGMRSILIPF